MKKIYISPSLMALGINSNNIITESNESEKFFGTDDYAEDIFIFE